MDVSYWRRWKHFINPFQLDKKLVHLLDHIVSLLVHQVNRKIAICKILWQKWQPNLEMKTHTLVCGHPPPVPFVAVHMEGSDITLRWCSWIVG